MGEPLLFRPYPRYDATTKPRRIELAGFGCDVVLVADAAQRRTWFLGVRLEAV